MAEILLSSLRAMQKRVHHYQCVWRDAGLSLLLLAVMLLAGCNSAKEAQQLRPAPTALVWPAPPEDPRIAYVQSIAKPDDVGIKRPVFSRFAHWLTGSEDGYSRLVKPFGIAFDEKDNLCLTDTGANLVCYYDRANNKWQQWAKIGKLRWVSPVAVAKQNQLFYVADSGRGSIVAFRENGKLAFETTNHLERPSGLAILDGKLLVADSRRHCIVCFDLLGQYLSEFGRRGTGPGEFNFPSHIAADARKRLYVTDSMNSRVQVLDAGGKFQRQIGSIGQSSGQFSRPKGVAADSFGHVYVIDALFDNLQIFDEAGRFLLTVGGTGSDYGQFWLPNGIVISRQNEIFVTDSYNHRLQVMKYVGAQ